MDKELIRRWNKVVGPDDTVYHLGDFTLGEHAGRYFEQLNGNILILKMTWHHDKRWNHNNNYMTKTGFVEFLPPMYVLDYWSAKLPDGKVIVLCHYPIASWDRKHYKSWHLHGHSHCGFAWEPTDLALDVGVDCWHYTPISIDQVIEVMKAKEALEKVK